MDNIVLNAIANPVRLKLLYCLSRERKNVLQLIEKCGLSQSAVSQHLLKLKGAGLVKDEREGKFVYYSLVNPGTVLLIRTIDNFLKEMRNIKS